MPCIVRGDRGTENSLIRDMQLALRSEHNDSLRLAGFMYGTSTHNQRIERWWRNLTAMSASYWKQLFRDLQEIGEFDNSNPVHVEALRFCFTRLIQRDFDQVVQEWNQHCIRSQNNEDSPCGKPDLIYYVPELYNCNEQKMPLLYCQQDLLNVERSFCREYPPFGCDPLFVDALNVLVGNCNNFTMPDNVEEAIQLYQLLMEILQQYM